MSDEKTLLFENIKNFRQLLNEDAGQSAIERAINNREVIQIYYAGDDTYRKGFRTIEPYVIGNIKKKDGAGDVAVRAWQQAGASDTFKNPIGRWKKIPPRDGHEVWHGQDTPFGKKDMPGWRLFKVKDITYVLPTGKNFPAKNKGARPLYKNGIDDGLVNIKTYAKLPSNAGEKQVTGVGSLDEPNVKKQKLSVFDPQSKKWGMVTNQEELELMNNLVALYEKVKMFDKQAPRYYDLTYKDDMYRAVRRNSNDRKKYTPQEVLGNLDDLYKEYESLHPDDMKEISKAFRNI